MIKIESTWRREIKEQAPQLALLYCGRTLRSRHRSCSIKKLFIKISQYPQETAVLDSDFKKATDLKACNFIKITQHRCFPVNIAKFLMLPISKNISDRLVLTVSIVHCYMDLKVQRLNCMMTSRFRVRVTGLVFCF